MAIHELSRITDPSGDHWDIKAKGLENQITLGATDGGDVTGQVTTDLTQGTTSTATLTIGDGKVTGSKLADGAVSTEKVADGAVTWDKIATSVKNGSIAGNSSTKLATCAQVKTYVDEQITGNGSYLGQKTCEQVSSMTGMHNGDHVSVSNAGTITNPDGSSTSVTAGDNVIYDETLRKWDCLAGNYKVKQDSVSDPTASSSTSTTFISGITQNENGVITPTKKTLPSASTSAKGIVQLSSNNSSSEQSKAATPKLVYDRVATREPKFTITYNATEKSLVLSKTIAK